MFFGLFHGWDENFDGNYDPYLHHDGGITDSYLYTHQPLYHGLDADGYLHDLGHSQVLEINNNFYQVEPSQLFNYEDSN